MASQRITIAKIGGVAADFAWLRLRGWADAREVADPDEWAGDQWPASIRIRVDAFADRLRAHSLIPPVISFAEWSDLWSMGDLFTRWLTVPGAPPPAIIHADRFEVYAYPLPDGDRLARHLASAGPQQFPEHDQFVIRLREAVEAWSAIAGKATLIVLREVVGGLVTDEELAASLAIVPDWLAGLD